MPRKVRLVVGLLVGELPAKDGPGAGESVPEGVREAEGVPVGEGTRGAVAEGGAPSAKNVGDGEGVLELVSADTFWPQTSIHSSVSDNGPSLILGAQRRSSTR